MSALQVELTGDYTPDMSALLSSDIIICTPEKWDGISRNWQARSYVRKVRCRGSGGGEGQALAGLPMQRERKRACVVLWHYL